MSNELQEVFNFEGQQVRTVSKNGEAWFIGKDIAEVLGYSDPAQAIRNHCKGVVESTTPSNGGTQVTKIIPEWDVYRLIMRSRLPKAEAFEEWVVGEVLPSIRKHGAYITDEVVERTLTDPDYLIQIAKQMKQERQARIQAEERALEHAQEAEALRPQADKYSEFLDATGYLNFTTVGNMLDMSAITLRQFLQHEGVISKKKSNNAWQARKGYRSYFKVFPHIREGVVCSASTKMTSKGADFVIKLYNGEITAQEAKVNSVGTVEEGLIVELNV